MKLNTDASQETVRKLEFQEEAVRKGFASFIKDGDRIAFLWNDDNPKGKDNSDIKQQSVDRGLGRFSFDSGKYVFRWNDEKTIGDQVKDIQPPSPPSQTVNFKPKELVYTPKKYEQKYLDLKPEK